MKKKSWLGGILGDANKYAGYVYKPVTNTIGDLAKLPVQIPQGIGTMIGASAYDLSHTGQRSRVTRDMMGGAWGQMKSYYTHPGQIYNHPLQAILDALTVATFGGAAAARLGRAGVLGEEGLKLGQPGRLTYDLGQGEQIVRTSSHNPTTRAIQEWRLNLINRMTDGRSLPVYGDRWTEANRGLKLESKRVGRRVSVAAQKALQPFDDATRGLTTGQKVAVSLIHQGTDPTTYRAQLGKFIQEDTQALAVAKTPNQARYWRNVLKGHARFDRWTAEAEKVWPTMGTDPKVAKAVAATKDLAHISEEIIHEHSLIHPEALADRPYLMARVLSGSRVLPNEEILQAVIHEVPNARTLFDNIDRTVTDTKVAAGVKDLIIRQARNIARLSKGTPREQIARIRKFFDDTESALQDSKFLDVAKLGSPEGALYAKVHIPSEGNFRILTSEDASQLPRSDEFVYHGSSTDRIKSIGQERALNPSMAEGRGEGKAWVTDNPKLAARYADSKAYEKSMQAHGGIPVGELDQATTDAGVARGHVIEIPRSAVPEWATHHSPVYGADNRHFGGNVWSSPTRVLFQDSSAPYPYHPQDFSTEHTPDTQAGRYAAPEGEAFYAPLHRFADALPDKVGVQELAGRLKSAGIKDEEVHYSGLGDFLSTAAEKGTKSISREELLSWLDQGYLRIEENVRHEPAVAGSGDSNAVNSDQTKFGGYTLPGGAEADYQEITIRLPADRYGNLHEHTGHFPDPNILAHARITTRMVDGEPSLFIEEIQSDWHQAAQKEGYTHVKWEDDPEYKAVLEHEQATMRQTVQATDYVKRHDPFFDTISTHPMEIRQSIERAITIKGYKDTGVARFIVREDPGASRYSRYGVYGEIHSGQPYHGDEALLRSELESHALTKAEEYNRYLALSEDQTNALIASRGAYADYIERAQQAHRQVVATERRLKGSSIADAPFKKTWHELAFKRMLSMAVERGFKNISWSTGDTQMDRYNLGHYFQELNIEEGLSERGLQEWASEMAQDALDHRSADEILSSSGMEEVYQNPGEHGYHPDDPEPQLEEFTTPDGEYDHDAYDEAHQNWEETDPWESARSDILDHASEALTVMEEEYYYDNAHEYGKSSAGLKVTGTTRGGEYHEIDVSDHGELSDVIGPELAKEYEQNGTTYFSGDGLIAGEYGKSALGAAHFYDKKLTGFVQKYLKKHGVNPTLSEISYKPAPVENIITRNRTTGQLSVEGVGVADIQEALVEAYKRGALPRGRVFEATADEIDRGLGWTGREASGDRAVLVHTWVRWSDPPEGLTLLKRGEHAGGGTPQWHDVWGPFRAKDANDDIWNAVTTKVLQFTEAAHAGGGTSVHSIRITPAVEDFVRSGQPLFQRVGHGGAYRGAYEYLGDKRGRITVAAGSAEGDTWAHESAHALRQQIAGTDIEKQIAKASGAKRVKLSNGMKVWRWDRAADEKFAGLHGAYLREEPGALGDWYRKHYNQSDLPELTTGARRAFKSLITKRAKLEGKDWWGGTSIEDLRAAMADSPPGYFPHVGKTLRDSRGISVRAGSRPLTKPDFVKFNTGWRVRFSQWLPDPAVLRDHHLKLMSYIRAKEMQKLALRVAEPVDADLTLKQGYRYIIAEDKARPTHLDLESGLLDQDLHELTGHGSDLQEFIDKNISSTSIEQAKKWADEGREIKQVSDTQFKILFGEFKAANYFIKKFYDDPTNVWRTLTLNYRPAWVVNNFVGQTLLYFMHHGGRGAVKNYLLAMRDEMTAQGREESPLAPELRYSGLFANESPITHSHLGRVRAVEHRIRNAINTFNANLSDNVPRNAAQRQLIDRFARTADDLGKLAQEVKAGRLALHDPRVVELHDAIIEKTLQSLVDFGDLSPFERATIRRIFPFYSWIKGIMKSTAFLTLDHPGRVLIMFLLAEQGEATGKSMWGDAASLLSGFVPYHHKIGPGGVQVGLSTAGINPLGTVGQTFGGLQGGLFGSQDSRDNPFTQSNPVLQAAAQAITHTTLFTGKKESGSTLGIFLKKLGAAPPVVPLIIDLIHPKDGSKKLTPQRRVELILRYLGYPQTRKNIPAAHSIAAKIKKDAA